MCSNYGQVDTIKFPVAPVSQITQERLKRVRVVELAFLRTMTALLRDLEACNGEIEEGALGIELRPLRHRIVYAEAEVVSIAS